MIRLSYHLSRVIDMTESEIGKEMMIESVTKGLDLILDGDPKEATTDEIFDVFAALGGLAMIVMNPRMREEYYNHYGTFVDTLVERKKRFLKKKIEESIASQSEEHSDECCICFENKAGRFKLSPCNHVAVCIDCVSKIKKCPLCRRVILDVKERIDV